MTAKRRRSRLACDRCHVRKIKCDRGRPCGNCIRHNAVATCTYPSPPETESPASSELDELRKENERLRRLVQQHGYATPTTPETSEATNFVQNFDTLIIKDRSVIHCIPTNRLSIVRGDRRVVKLFQDFRWFNQPLFEDCLLEKGVERAKSPSSMSFDEQLSTSVSSYKSNHTSSSLLTGRFRSREILHDIQDLLPPMYTVRALVDNFFEHVYYLFPYVDEDSFREDLGRMGLNSGHLIIPEAANASSISLLLLVLRFSYLGIPGFGHPGAIKNVTLRLMVASGISIGPNFVEMARNLLLSVGGVHSIFNRITLPRIQCLLYLRIYQRFSPELNEANAENSLFVCLLAQMCKLVGLNRDPDFFPELIKKDSVKSIWRKIFYKLMSLDILDAYQYGSSTMFLEGQYDTKLPRLSDSDEKALRLFSSDGVLGTDSDPQRLKKLALERSVNQDIELEYKLCVILRRGLQPYQEVARKMPADQLGSVLRELTDFRTEYFPKISSLMADSYVKGSIEELFQTPRSKRLEIGSILLMQIETFGYIGYLGGLDTLDGAYKATDATICLFKLSSDFASHLCGWDNNDEAHGRIERYCDGLTRFLSVHVQKCFERCLFWLMSVMASELQSGEQRFEQLIGNLEESADVAAVKQWLHDEKTGGISMEQLFERLRTYFAALTQLRDDYFICWRNRVMVKLFFIFFRRLDEARFNQFFGNDSMVKAASAGVKAVVAEGGSTPVLPSIDTLEEEINAMVDNGEYGSSIVDWLQSDNVANIFGIEFPPGNEG